MLTPNPYMLLADARDREEAEFWRGFRIGLLVMAALVLALDVILQVMP